MNNHLMQAAKNDFKEDFLKLMNNQVFRKTMENVREHWDIKLIRTEIRTKLLYYTDFYNQFVRYRNQKYSDTNK